VFILEHYFASQSFVAFRDKSSMRTYPDKEVPNKTKVTQIGDNISGHKKCLSVTNAHRATKRPKLRPFTASAATYKAGSRPWRTVFANNVSQFNA
jgi:hypothetical protein